VNHVLYGTAGTYTVTLKYIACSVDSITQVITIISGFHDSIAVINPINCHYKGKATAYPSSGVAPYTYSWSNGTTTAADTGLGAGTYTCVVTGNNGCRDTTTCVIKNPVSPPFLTKPDADTGFCIGGKVTLSVSKGSNFVWSPSTSLSCTSCPNPVASPTVTTTYTVTGIDSVGCPDSAKIEVNVSTVPVFSITSNIDSCSGYNELQGTFESGWAYFWSPSKGLADTIGSVTYATPTVTTTYTLTVFNGFCSGTQTITVPPFSPNIPVTIIAKPDTICQGGTISLSFTSSKRINSQQWSPSPGISCTTCSTTTLNTNLISLTSSTYTLAVEVQGADSFSKCYGYDTIAIHIFTDHINNENVEICTGSSATLTATSNANYLWNTGATTSSISVSPAINTTYYVIVDSSGCQDSVFTNVVIDTGPIINLSTPKDTVCPGGNTPLIALSSKAASWSWLPATGLSCYTCHNTIATVNSKITYTVTAVDSMGCTSTDSITLNTLSPHSKLLDTYTYCSGHSVTLTITDGNAYLWSNGATTNSITVSPTDSGHYYVVVTFNGNCQDTIFQRVIAVPKPVPVITTDTLICTGINDTLFASGGTTYLWSNGSTATFIIVNLTKDSSISLTAYNGDCPKDTSVKLTVATPPKITISVPSLICPGDSVTLSATGGGTYLWSNGFTSSSITIKPNSDTSYSVTVTNGCKAKDSAKVTLYSPPLHLCCDTTIYLGDTAILIADSSLFYSWLPSAGLNCYNCPTVMASPSVTTTYTVTGIDNQGCSITKYITVIVELRCEDFFVPNVFTPGVNGINAQFFIKTEDLSQYSIIIYDRWGKEMYKSNDPNQAWNGNTEEGANAPDGVYYYIIKSICKNNTYNKNGYVQLIR
jgi:gliding motility-associated-like protein